MTNRIILILLAAVLVGCDLPTEPNPAYQGLGDQCRTDRCDANLECVAMADTKNCMAPSGESDPKYRPCDSFVCTRACASPEAKGAPCAGADGREGYCDVVTADDGSGGMRESAYCMPSCDEFECPAGLYRHDRDFGGCTCLPFVSAPPSTAAPTFGSVCDKTTTCPKGMNCVNSVDFNQPICMPKCDSEDACAALGGTCGWVGIAYPGGAIVDSWLCLPS